MTVTAAVLAGGLGTRIGGDKALVRLGGRPLISYPLEAARSAGLDAVVLAKRSTALPPLDVPILLEPDSPIHPLLGIITALTHFAAVIAVPCDMPFLDPTQLAALAAMPDDLATLAPDQPFPSLYRRALLPQLRQAVDMGASVRSTQEQATLAPAATGAMRPDTTIVVNTPAELAAAEALLSRR